MQENWLALQTNGCGSLRPISDQLTHRRVALALLGLDVPSSEGNITKVVIFKVRKVKPGQEKKQFTRTRQGEMN